MPFTQFSGIMINIESIPKWIAWYGYLDPLRYTLDALSNIMFPYEYTQPVDVPEKYGYRLGYATSCWILFGMAISLRILSYLFLYSKRN